MQDVLETMAQQRPVFHSEADMQLEPDWQTRLDDPLATIRPETCPSALASHLDVLVHRTDLALTIAEYD